MATKCSVEGCSRPSWSKGLCGGHRAQSVRGVPFTPLEPRVSGSVPVKVRVSPATLRALGPRPGAKARVVLETWATGRREVKGLGPEAAAEHLDRLAAFLGFGVHFSGGEIVLRPKTRERKT